MPNFLFEFTDTTIQTVQTIIEADTQEAAQELFDSGNWEVRIKDEVTEERSLPYITEVGPETAQQVAWKNQIYAPMYARVKKLEALLDYHDWSWRANERETPGRKGIPFEDEGVGGKVVESQL